MEGWGRAKGVRESVSQRFRFVRFRRNDAFEFGEGDVLGQQRKDLDFDGVGFIDRDARFGVRVEILEELF